MLWGRQGKGLRQCRLGDKVIPEQRSEGSQGVRYVCIDREGEPQHQQGQRGRSPVSWGRAEDGPRRDSGSRSLQALQVMVRTLIFFKRYRKTTGGF